MAGSPEVSGRRAALVAVAVLLGTPAAPAQTSGFHGLAGAATGVEGGNAADQGVAYRRARTRVMAGADVVADESAYPAFGLRGFVEVEQRVTVGIGAQLTRWATPAVGLYVGPRAVLAPETLLGAAGGATFLLPLGRQLFLFAEPEVAAMPLGSDVPKGSVVVWGLLSLGVRVGI
ncbi:MAG: hypothetical protein FJ104_00315 [Deltaproteobacteria bacterium]|nr:hypothetical protein [Deltaproteobacteria bacterium]